jgi:hypothetical protein
MNSGNTVFYQLRFLIPDYELSKCIDRYRGNFHARRFTYRDQFLVISYAQLTRSASLRSIETQLNVFNTKLYHAGLKVMPKSTLAHMKEKKDWVSIRTMQWKLCKLSILTLGLKTTILGSLCHLVRLNKIKFYYCLLAVSS